MNFNEKLYVYRKQQGMSQEKLAEVIGVSRQAVSKWESGQSYPEMDKLMALSELFQVSLDHLVKAAPFEEKESTSGISEISTRYAVEKLHYEYKSKAAVMGVPLVHIHVGRGMQVAKGVIAIGNVSIGVLSVGIIALGGISFGAVALGFLTFAALAVGVLIAAGGLAVGAVAFGGLAVGVIAVGGCAVSSQMAIGGYAMGHIAIGDMTSGVYTYAVGDHSQSSAIPVDEIKGLIKQEFQGLWQRAALWMVSWFK